MPTSQDTPLPDLLDVAALDAKLEATIQRFEAVMRAQKDEFNQRSQQIADETSAAFQARRQSTTATTEAQKKQVKQVSSEDSDHSDAKKYTSERVDTKITKPIPEASAVVLCSRCKVECGVPVSYEEFEETVATPAKLISDLRSPPENFQPASPKHVRSQQEVSEKD